MSSIGLPTERVHDSAASDPAKKFTGSTGAYRKEHLPSNNGRPEGTAT